MPPHILIVKATLLEVFSCLSDHKYSVPKLRFVQTLKRLLYLLPHSNIIFVLHIFLLCKWTVICLIQHVFLSPQRSEVQYNLYGSNTDGSFTVDDSNSFFQSLENPSNSSRKQILRDLFLILSWNCMLCVLIRITSLCRKSKKIPLNSRYLLPELVPWLTFSGSNYLCLERITMIPKMFEPLRFDCKFWNHYHKPQLAQCVEQGSKEFEYINTKYKQRIDSC